MRQTDRSWRGDRFIIHFGNGGYYEKLSHKTRHICTRLHSGDFDRNVGVVSDLSDWDRIWVDHFFRTACVCLPVNGRFDGMALLCRSQGRVQEQGVQMFKYHPVTLADIRRSIGMVWYLRYLLHTKQNASGLIVRPRTKYIFDPQSSQNSSPAYLSCPSIFVSLRLCERSCCTSFHVCSSMIGSWECSIRICSLSGRVRRVFSL